MHYLFHSESKNKHLKKTKFESLTEKLPVVKKLKF